MKKEKKPKIRNNANKIDLPISLTGPDPDVGILRWGRNVRTLIYFATGANARSTTTTAINMDTAIVIVTHEC